MKKKYIGILIIIFFVFAFFLILFFVKKEYKKERNGSEDSSDSIDVEIALDNGDEKIDWGQYPTWNYELKDSIIISKEGTYQLTGNIPNGNITIECSGNVRLLLNSVSITNSSGPAIYVKKAEDVVIVTEGDSILEDGKEYKGYDSDVIGIIYSSSDITFDGNATLTLHSNKEDAIVGKDDLKIINGIYEIESVDDGIRGKDSVYIKNGNFKIVSGGDAIKSTNTKDSSKGFILIENGTFDLTSTLDGIQAETKLIIQNGMFQVTTGGGSSNSSDKNTWGNWGNSKSTESAKGLKAGNNLVIENGTFKVDSSDDAIHSNYSIGIRSGNFTILSGDDGIHADNEIIIDGGTIDIQKSYEGIESSKITINDGKINVISYDDGVNVAGGKDSSAMSRPGANSFSSNDNILTINGGDIYVDSSGDGLDANGAIYMNGGVVKIDGPQNSGNGALDYDKECVITGGTLLAGGASGMAQGVSNNSTIYNLFINFSSTYGKDDKIAIMDANNKEIISYQSDKNYSSLVVATTLLKKGEYKLLINGEEKELFTISNLTTQIGSSNGMNMPSGNRRPDGGGRKEEFGPRKPTIP